MIGVVLMLFQAFTGINTVIFYSTTIFELAGVENTVSEPLMFSENTLFECQFVLTRAPQNICGRA